MIAENLSDLFQYHLELAYDGERQIVTKLPEWIEPVSSSHLRTVLEGWLEQSKVHAQRLDRIFASLSRAAGTSETNHVVHNFLNESAKLVKHIDRSPLLDSALIIAANQATQNEIARYGALASLARLQGLSEAAGLLAQTLAEKKTADRTLTELAVTLINPEAVGFQNSPRGIIML